MTKRSLLKSALSLMALPLVTKAQGNKTEPCDHEFHKPGLGLYVLAGTPSGFRRDFAVPGSFESYFVAVEACEKCGILRIPAIAKKPK